MVDFKIGDEVAILSFGAIVDTAVIVKESKCFWVLDSGGKVKKATGRIQNQGYHQIAILTAKLKEAIAVRRATRATNEREAAEKSKLSDYIDYISAGNFRPLTPNQVRDLLKAFNETIGVFN